MGAFKRKIKQRNGKTTIAKNWSIEFYVDGIRYCRTISGSEKFTLRKANELCDEEKRLKEQEIFGSDSITFEEGLLAYYENYKLSLIERQSHTHKKVNDKYKYLIDMLINEFQGILLNKLQRKNIVEFILKLRRNGRKDSSIMNYVVLLSAMFYHCESIGLIEVHEVPNFRAIKRLLKSAKTRNRYLNEKELDQIISKASERTRRIILFAVETGMRKEEYLSLLWKNVDIANRKLYVNDTKNGRDRIVPISELALQQLQQQQQQNTFIRSPYVFCIESTGERLKDYKKGFKGACERAGVLDVTIHDLRRTFGSWRLQGIRGKKLDLKEVSLLLGHTTTRMTERTYAFLDEMRIEL